MKIAAIAGMCISAAVLCRLFDKESREYGVFISSAAVLIITVLSVTALSPVIEFIDSLYEETGADEKYILILYKVLGICFITSVASGICRDSGENALAAQAETAGRIAAAVLSLPVFSEIAEYVRVLLAG